MQTGRSHASSGSTPLMSEIGEDPLDADAVGDEVVVTTRRCLLRLVLVAVETTAHIEREGLDVDPVAWMVEPRRMFDGRAALEACLTREACLKAILLHGLSDGLDADPVDAEDHWKFPAVPGGLADGSDDDNGGSASSFVIGRGSSGDRPLLAAVGPDQRAGRLVYRSKLRPLPDARAEILAGLDPARPFARAMAVPVVTDVLVRIERDAGYRWGRGPTPSDARRLAA